MKHLKIFLCLFFMLIQRSVFSQNVHFISDSLDQYIEREMNRWNIPGLAIAIVKDGKTIVSKGYGVTDLDTQNPVNNETLFMIASNTKAFTGTALSLLQYQKNIRLDDKVLKYMPEFKLYDPISTQLVTIRDLLCHRIGLETFQGDFLNWSSDLTRLEIIQHMQYHKPAYEFRNQYGYCNSAFLTAGEIIPIATDTSWDDFLKYRFFIPLKMNRTSTQCESIVLDKNACSPYTIFQNKLVEIKYDQINNLGPAASINSCVEDLTHWMKMYLANGIYEGEQIFPKAVLDEVKKPQFISGSGGSRLYPSQHFKLYGLGFELTDFAGKKLVWHTGGANGFVTSLCLVPEENLGITILTNTDANSLFIACMYQILESYFNLPYRNLSATYFDLTKPGNDAANDEIYAWKTLAESNPKQDLELISYTGKYENSVYGTMDIQIENKNLTITFENHPQLKGHLKPLGGNRFMCTYDPIPWGVKEIPFTIENNKVISATITVNDFIDFLPYEFIKQ